MPDTNQTLHEVVETLAPLRRRAGTEPEHEAAQWLAQRLERSGTTAEVEEEWFYDGYAKQLLPLGLAGALAGVLSLCGRRRPAAALGTLAAAAIADDASNGARVWRKLISSPKRTWNVVAQAGDERVERTLVLLAHHDAAPTGRIFDQGLQHRLADNFPDLVQRSENSPPLWWPIAGAPALASLSAITGSRRLAALASALSALNVGLGVDLARERIVPGANDNLSGVAALVALAELLREAPVAGVRVLLASCGAEEVLQGGIYGFAERHLQPLSRERTWVLNLDTIGSPRLVMLEGEGTFRMEDYPRPEFRDLVADAATAAGVTLHRGARARSSTDSVIPSRAGFPTATLISWDPHTRLPTDYHLMSDVPENVRYDTVADAVQLCHALAVKLAAA